MNESAAQLRRLELNLARLLNGGVFLACGVICFGIIFSPPAINWGVVIFILLPILRVVVMLYVFLRERDYRLAGLALLVLLIISAVFTLGH